jgi:hypothetical protein
MLSCSIDWRTPDTAVKPIAAQRSANVPPVSIRTQEVRENPIERHKESALSDVPRERVIVHDKIVGTNNPRHSLMLKVTQRSYINPQLDVWSAGPISFLYCFEGLNSTAMPPAKNT